MSILLGILFFLIVVFYYCMFKVLLSNFIDARQERKINKEIKKIQEKTGRSYSSASIEFLRRAHKIN